MFRVIYMTIQGTKPVHHAMQELLQKATLGLTSVSCVILWVMRVSVI